MANKEVREKSRYANCMVDKSRFLKQKRNKKRGQNDINPKLHTLNIIKHVDILSEVQRKCRKCRFKSFKN